MWIELTNQLKSSANRWLLQVIGSLTGVLGVIAFVLVKAPVAAQYGMLLTLALFGLWIVFALVSYTKRSAAPVDQTTQPEAPSRLPPADSRSALDAAVHWLESKTQLRRKQAAGDRPWFLVFGGPKSGKTTLLSATGLDIQYPSWGNQPEQARATRGYGVFVTERAVVLDTPGEFMATSGPGAGDALVGLLKQVARLRRREPLNGILVVLDASQFLHLAKADLQGLAFAYRAQLQRIGRAIGRNVPVYLLVSKCDELRDFDNFFADLAVHHPLTPAWGFTLSDAERESPEWLAHCDRGLSSLYQRLITRRTAQLRLADESARGSLIAFPERFQELRDRLRIFLEPLFGRTRTSGYSLIRGVYFLGGLGGDTPAKSMAVVPRRFAESARTLLGQVVFTNPSRGTAPGWRELWAFLDVRTVLLAGVALTLAVLLGAGVYPAYRDNVRVVRAGQRLAKVPPEASLPERVTALSELRESLLDLGADEHFTPTRRWHWTMFVGDARLAVGLRAYEEGVVKTFIESPGQCGATLAQALASEQEGERLYRALKTYLMVTAPGMPHEGLTAQDQSRNSRFLLAEHSPLAACWGSGLGDAANTKEHLRFFVHRLAEHPGEIPLPPQGAAAAQQVAAVRRRLSQQNDIRAYYEQLAALRSEAAPSIELSAANGTIDVLARAKGASSGDTSVLGVFTRAGWQKLAQPKIQQLTEEYGRERAWILNLPANANEVRDELRRRYFMEYRDRWTRAIQALRVTEFQNWNNAAVKLFGVSGQPDSDPKTSAYFTLLTLVAENTWAPGTGDSAPVPTEFAAVAAGFRSLHAMVASAAEKPFALQSYLVAIHALYLKMSSYDVTDSCAVKNAALPAIGTAVRDAKEAAVRLSRTDPSLSNVGTMLRQPVDSIGRLHAAEVNKCSNTGPPSPAPPPPPPPSGPTAPTVSLIAVPLPGGGATIQWESERATILIVSPDIGRVAGPKGSLEVHPKETTTYTLEGFSASGESKTSSVVVPGQPTPAPTQPVEASVSGRITEDGKPKKDAEVFLRTVAVGAPLKAKSSRDGTFRFDKPVDLSGTFELCYPNVSPSSCFAVGNIRMGASHTFEDTNYINIIKWQAPTRHVVVMIRPAP